MYMHTPVRKIITPVVCHEISTIWIGFVQKGQVLSSECWLTSRWSRKDMVAWWGEHEQRHKERSNHGWSIFSGKDRWASRGKRRVLWLDWQKVSTNDTSLSRVRVRWASRSQCAWCFISNARGTGLESTLNVLDAKQTWVGMMQFREAPFFFTKEALLPADGQWAPS